MIDWVEAWFHPERSLGASSDYNLAQTAMPIWATLIVVELAASNFLGKKVYSLRQSISNLSSGLLMLTFMGVVMKSLHVLPYVWVHRNFALLPSPSPGAATPWWSHLAAFLFCDIAFYTIHRMMHECNLGWAAHVVHHSSMDYNYTTALRQGFGETLLSWVAYLPLALVCPPEMYALHRGINTVHQSFMHTQLVYKLWWPVELVFNTPSHHRVHHARNYGRKNHGGILIVWDRLFGTFQEERLDRPPQYGLNAQTVTQGTYNPLWHQVHHMVATARLAASGQVSTFMACFTRVTGPGMVHPSITSSSTAAAPARAHASGGAVRTKAAAGEGGAASKKGGAPAGGAAVVELKAYAPREQQQQPKMRRPSAGGKGEEAASAAAPAPRWDADATRASTASRPAQPTYAWEARALGLLDVYAALHFFVLAVPGAFAFLAITRSLSPPEILGGGAFSCWTLITLAWLCGGQPVTITHELIRLVVQALVAQRLLQAPLLPGVLAIQLAQAVLALSLLSFPVVASQLPRALRAGKGAAAAKAAA